MNIKKITNSSSCTVVPTVLIKFAAIVLLICFQSAFGIAQAQEQVLCGKPTYDKRVDRGTFVWRACDGSNRFDIRVTGGGSSTQIIYKARVDTPKISMSVGIFNLEPNDVWSTGVTPSSFFFYYELKVKGGSELSR